MQLQLDMVGLPRDEHAAVLAAVAEAAGVAREQVILAFSHTHAAGLFSADRAHLPGGELIAPYLAEMRGKVQEAARRAVAAMQDVTITYATGRCTLAGNRDYWDAERGAYACGYNPDAAADDTLLVARITGADGAPAAAVVNYACHPTTLAWDNTLISPDYVGAMREVVEQATGAPCIFTLGACGDLGPRRGYVGDTAIADRNGRQLGYAALTTLESMLAPEQDFHYTGPVVSGATLGSWGPLAMTEGRRRTAAVFEGGRYVVDLPQRPHPPAAEYQAEMERRLALQREADAAGDAVAARDHGAMAERARRWLMRLRTLPEGPTYPFHYTVYRLGDALWVSVGAEPYNLLQTELRRRFPQTPIVVTVMAGEMSVAYLLPSDRYGKGLYQEEPSILARGCLETLINSIAEKIGTPR